MYVRVKRRKQTIFLHSEPTDTLAQLKAKLQDIVQQVCRTAKLTCLLTVICSPST